MAKINRNNVYKSIHREILKSNGCVHLPSNKVENPKTAYKRLKIRVVDVIN